MSILLKESVKYKLLTFDELVINLDRLSRFKLPETSYNRVFNSIIYRNLISPKYSQTDIERLSADYISQIVKKIWNESVYNLFGKCESFSACQKALLMLSDLTFKNIDERTKKLICTKLNISPILEKIDYNSSPYNLRFLKKVNEIFKSENITKEDIFTLRIKYALKFPISKLIIVEGITEEILLPVFASKLNHDFNKEGIYILGAGGKSKSPSIYMELKDKLKIPINLLFDSDAIEVFSLIQKNLLQKDKAFIIQNGEFEDILSLNLIKRALNNEYLPVSPISIKELSEYESMCKNIENFYRTRHLGEYKKSKVSKIIAKNVKYPTDITEQIKNLIINII